MKTFSNAERMLALVFFSVFFFIDLSAQVTIGMAEAPAKAGLLQIKDQVPDNENITSRRGGLILPRVSLVNLSTLEPFISPSDPNYMVEKSLHVGLMVYNMTRSGSLIPGLYFWDGNEWSILKATYSPIASGNPQRSDAGGKILYPETEVPTSITDTEGLKLSNSYIVPPGKEVVFPVMKAYSVWVQLLSLSEIELGGSLSVELLWQDTNALISSVSLRSGDQSSASEIRVVTNSSELEGNAVVALKINNVIRWSWHIWVTNYNPNNTTNQRTYNSRTFMDRNMGSTDANEGDLGSLGLLYQWGRKDPFVGASSILANNERTLYTLSGSSIKITKTSTPTSSNLSAAVVNPLTFYYNANSNKDWYSSDGTRKNDNLWNSTSGSKTAFDPCPHGWRVPSGGVSVWSGLGNTTFDEGKGANWATAGFYPAAGYRSSTNGNLTAVGTEGYVWTASTYYNDVYRLYFKSHYTQTDQTNERARALSVRCVLE